MSRPELGDIHVDDLVFAVGRFEQPFASFGSDLLSRLSRRHARIFREGGLLYLVDLGSKNGTTLNRVAVSQVPCQLRDGDEICFGGALSYRVQITSRALEPQAERSLTLTLTPESSDSGLAPIVITKFPFLVGKAHPTFSRYKIDDEHGRERSYLSRRHAYIFQRGGQAYIEDLASDNGTLVDGQRLAEHAVPMQDGAVVAFGGRHFVYRVGINRESGDVPTARVASPAIAEGIPAEAPPNDGTRFVGGPTSFLEIFCVGDEADVEMVDSAPPGAGSLLPTVSRRPRARAMLLLSELAALLAGDEPDIARRTWRKAVAVAGTLGALVLTAYLWSASERDLQDAFARGEYARAAGLASRLLDKHPDDVDLKARVTEAALRANVPAWIAKLRARDFDAAKGVLAGMSQLATRDADLRHLIDELQWLGDLERLVGARGGPEAPIRIYADEDSIERIVGRWNDDTGEHQRILVRIASYVPQFENWYGKALSLLRRLQSESTVLLPVIERVKADITTELGKDDPEALEPVLRETAEKYPGLGGMDSVRNELARYIEIRREARSGKSGRLFALLRKARFGTPPFEQSLRALTENGQLPSADLLRQYAAATQAWKDGNADEAFAGLQKMTAGPWGEAAAHELERRRGVAARSVALQQSRNASGFVDQLLAFRESLDADEDVYFLRATAADLNLQRDKVIAWAQDAMNRARTLWQEYRSDGAIYASLRIEPSISEQFRTRARLLADANRYAQQAVSIYSQVDPAGAGRWTPMRDQIEAEARQQRSALTDLSNVVEPGVLKAKLALLGEANE